VEDVAAARDGGQGQFVPGHQAGAAVADEGLGGQAAGLQLQQAHAPGDGITLFFQTQQIAIGGIDIDADQHGSAGLEDLIVGTDADAGQVVLVVEGAGAAHGGAGQVVQVAQRAGAVEQVAEQLLHAAVGTVADQQQGQAEALQPALGHGQGEEDGVGGGLGGEGLSEGVLGLGGLLVDELAADGVGGGQVGDGLTGQGREGELLAGRGRQGGGGRGRGRGRGRGGGEDAQAWGSGGREGGGTLGRRGPGFLSLHPPLTLLPRIEPGPFSTLFYATSSFFINT